MFSDKKEDQHAEIMNGPMLVQRQAKMGELQIVI